MTPKQAYQRAYYQANRHRLLQYQAAWYRRNRTARQKAMRAHYDLHTQRIQAYSRQWNVRRRDSLKREVMARYGGRCAQCGFTDLRALCIDHVAGNGRAHRQAIGGGGGRTYRWLLEHGCPPGFQILCANCNLIKAISAGELGRRGAAPFTAPPQTQLPLPSNA